MLKIHYIERTSIRVRDGWHKVLVELRGTLLIIRQKPSLVRAIFHSPSTPRSADKDDIVFTYSLQRARLCELFDARSRPCCIHVVADGDTFMLDAGSAAECAVWYELLTSATDASEALETGRLPEYCAVVEKGDELEVTSGLAEQGQVPEAKRSRRAECICPRCWSNARSEEIIDWHLGSIFG